MRWQRAARFVLVVAGLATAVAIYVLTRERPVEDAPPPLPDERDARQVSGPGTVTFARDGRKAGDLQYERSVEYPDGRMRFERARYADVRGFSFTADAVVARGATTAGGAPTEVELVGAVTFQDASGLNVETVNATYDDARGVLTMPGEVTFSRGRLSGRGVGAVYERDAETIRLLAEASAVVAADADGKGAADATAATMTLRRTQKSLQMDQQARITTETETLSGDTAHLFFTEDETALRFLELRGHASVVPVDARAGGTPDMRATDITMTFHPGGSTVEHATLTGAASLQLSGASGMRSIRGAWIDLFTAADGRTLTRLESKGDVVVVLPASDSAPAREIRAATLLATGREPQGLEQARFQTGVRFVEAGRDGTAAKRTVTSAALVLALGGDLEAIERAEFQRDVVFLDGAVRGNADLAVYDARHDRVHLTPGTRTPPRVPQVADEDVTVNGLSIDLDMKTHDMRARGAVTTVSTPRGERRGGALFDGDDPILGAAAELDYRRATRTAAYTGAPGAPAKVMQGTNVIEGGAITFAEDTGNLDAEGRVRTTFVMARDDGATPTEYRTSAHTFQYDDGTRLALYRSEAAGALVEMAGSDKSLTVGRTIRLTLAEASRTVEELRVESEVWAKLPDGAEVKGATLTYREATGIYVLTGSPAIVKSAPDGKSETCTKTVGETIEFNHRTRSVSQPRAGQAFNEASPIPCRTSIR
jgi:lipopolysaccharide export system protein LptA